MTLTFQRRIQVGGNVSNWLRIPYGIVMDWLRSWNVRSRGLSVIGVWLWTDCGLFADIAGPLVGH